MNGKSNATLDELFVHSTENGRTIVRRNCKRSQARKGRTRRGRLLLPQRIPAMCDNPHPKK